MDKIYGFKKQDVEKLIKYLEESQNKPLSSVFEEYANAYGKSKGTVRNMYYALARKSREDKEFTDKYLGGKEITVQKIAEFNQDEERELIKNVLEGKRKGKSVRAVINEMALGDNKLALRYQNKFRNVLKNKQSLTAEIAMELREEYGETTDVFGLKEKPRVNEIQLRRLQREINGLLEKLTGKLKRENAYLKTRLSQVEVENMRLKNILYGTESGKNPANFFKKDAGENALS